MIIIIAFIFEEREKKSERTNKQTTMCAIKLPIITTYNIETIRFDLKITFCIRAPSSHTHTHNRLFNKKKCNLFIFVY